MKLHESYSFTIKDNINKDITRRMSSNNLLKYKILVILSIVVVFTLSLIKINPIIVSDLKRFYYREYPGIYMIIIFTSLLWAVSYIIYKNYYNVFRSKVYLVKEIEKNRRVNLELKRENEELKTLSYTDELTGIPNRRSFVNFIDYEAESKLKKEALISIVMIDIDFFKQYNDCLGHSEGNKIIYAVAKEINSVCRCNTDIAARYGGDEFILASINTDEKQIYEIAKVIKNKVQEIIIPNNKLKSIRDISVSIGTSTVKVNTKADIYRCIELADKALYEAKTNGRNCVISKPDIVKKKSSKYYKAS